ncbi:MAG: MATE family efflux transporter [Legionellaceae bacterium]|nr:MATE family efflux transporter [Legionellaceae bacterium]
MDNIESTSINIPLIHNPDTTESYADSFQKISKLSWQMSASYTFSMQVVILVYLLSQLDDSDENLAAITLITTLLNAIVAVGISPLLTMSLVAGRELGELQEAEKTENFDQLELRRKHISAVFGNGLIMSAGMTPFMLSGMIFSKSLLVNVFNQNEEVAEITQNFLRPYSIAIPAIMVRVCADQVMFTFKRTKPAMIIGLLNFAFSMTLGSLLAFGTAGFPKMEESGILIGCILDGYLTAIGFALYLAKSERLKDFDFFDVWQPWQQYLGQLKSLINLSKSMLVSMISETAMNFTASNFAGIIGVQPQAVFSAIMQFSLFSMLLQIAFGQTAAQELSREIGASRFKNASRIGKVGVGALLAYIVPVLIALSVYPDILVDILNQNDNQYFVSTLRYLAPIMFIGCIFDAVRFLLLQELRVLGCAQQSTFISCACIVFGIITSGLLGLKTKMGIYGIATGYTASAVTASVILSKLWIKRITPDAIEEIKKNPEQFSSSDSCCVGFFNRKRNNGNSLEIRNPMAVIPDMV